MMKTIATFSKPEEAHLLRMRLEAGGVPAYVLDENVIQVNWFYSNAVGGVRLQVAEEDFDRAHEIMSEPGDSLPDVILLRCPSCHSENVVPLETARRVFFLSILLLHFPLPIRTKDYKCNDCGLRWDEHKRPV